MHVVLYGATGMAGSRILAELVSRGHQVTAVLRDSAKANLPSGVATKQDDLSDASKIAATVQGADAVVSAYKAPDADPDQLAVVTARFIQALESEGSPRFVMVGGAGVLELAPGLALVDSGLIPEAWMGQARAHSKALALLKASEVNWTYFSPAGYFEPGERTGKFRLGTTQLIADDSQQSRISMEDYAIGLVDELEHPAHLRGQLSIGY